MNVDREQQRQILQLLMDTYPSVPNSVGAALKTMEQQDPIRLVANLLYLQKHGLITETVSITHGASTDFDDPDTGACWYTREGLPELTAKGIDFMLGDEGLSAVLNVQTIRVDLSCFKQMLTEYANHAQATEEQKSAWKEIIKGASSQALANLLGQLLSATTPQVFRSLLEHIA